jgi:hypothetical protein
MARRLPHNLDIIKALAGLGESLRDLRRCRRIPMVYAAQRALISRSTLHKVERGDPGVSLGVYATVLASYGLLDRLEHLVLMRWDRSHLPRRVRSPSV